MTNPRLKTAFDEMDASRVRESLNKLCDCGKMIVEDSTGKIEVHDRNIFISKGFIDLTQSNDSDGEDERKDNSGVGSYNNNDNDNEDELAKKEADDGDFAVVDNESLPELEAAETTQELGTMTEQEIDEADGIFKSADQQTNKRDEEAFEDKEGYSEKESDIDSWYNSDDDNDAPALRKNVCFKKEKLKIFECENCDPDFNIKDNKKGDYSFHPGERELDKNYAEDYHWPNYGEPWNSVDDSEYADRFVWSCCKRF